MIHKIFNCYNKYLGFAALLRITQVKWDIVSRHLTVTNSIAFSTEKQTRKSDVKVTCLEISK